MSLKNMFSSKVSPAPSPAENVLQDVFSKLNNLDLSPGKKTTIRVTQQDFSQGENTTWEKVIDLR